MADARALLRAHRAENRIKHPWATYSDAGKLLCKLCHEAVKSEALWEGHVRGANHGQRLAALQAQTAADEERNKNNNRNKRKHDDVDESMSDDAGPEEEGGGGDSAPKKRSKTNSNTQTPPHLARRTSNTPTQGVEIAIPSRPATPHAGSNSSNSTPMNLPIGASRSPFLGGHEGGGPSTPGSFSSSFASHNHSHLRPTATTTTNNNHNNNTAPPTAAAAVQQQASATAPNTAVDEAEWAAFEAEIAQADSTSSLPSYATADATISAPAMTADQLAAAAAKSQEEANARRKTLSDTAIADEREDAAQRLEAEFDEMEELAGRVRRLKARREELLLRKAGGGSGGSAADPRGASIAAAAAAAGRGFAFVGVGGGGSDGSKNNNGNADEEEDGDDEDEEDEEYDVFRFRA